MQIAEIVKKAVKEKVFGGLDGCMLVPVIYKNIEKKCHPMEEEQPLRTLWTKDEEEERLFFVSFHKSKGGKDYAGVMKITKKWTNEGVSKKRHWWLGFVTAEGDMAWVEIRDGLGMGI